MRGKKHSFSKSLEAGKFGEERLDKLFGRMFYIEPVTVEVEKEQGIDRVFRPEGAEWALAVEYKTDAKAAKTGNAFIETVSVDITGAPGWAKKSKADMLAYYVPGLRRVYWLKMSEVRRCLPRWQKDYPKRPSWNDGYRSWGHTVPLSIIENVADAVIEGVEL